jgi:hypothetical protein
MNIMSRGFFAPVRPIGLVGDRLARGRKEVSGKYSEKPKRLSRADPHHYHPPLIEVWDKCPKPHQQKIAGKQALYDVLLGTNLGTNWGEHQKQKA